MTRGYEVGAAGGFTKKFIKCKNFKISDFADHEHLDYKNIDAQKQVLLMKNLILLFLQI